VAWWQALAYSAMDIRENSSNIWATVSVTRRILLHGVRWYTHCAPVVLAELKSLYCVTLIDVSLLLRSRSTVHERGQFPVKQLYQNLKIKHQLGSSKGRTGSRQCTYTPPRKTSGWEPQIKSLLSLLRYSSVISCLGQRERGLSGISITNSSSVSAATRAVLNTGCAVLWREKWTRDWYSDLFLQCGLSRSVERHQIDRSRMETHRFSPHQQDGCIESWEGPHVVRVEALGSGAIVRTQQNWRKFRERNVLITKLAEVSWTKRVDHKTDGSFVNETCWSQNWREFRERNVLITKLAGVSWTKRVDHKTGGSFVNETCWSQNWREFRERNVLITPQNCWKFRECKLLITPANMWSLYTSMCRVNTLRTASRQGTRFLLYSDWVTFNDRHMTPGTTKCNKSGVVCHDSIYRPPPHNT
jgi:hypothetical protein